MRNVRLWSDPAQFVPAVSQLLSPLEGWTGPDLLQRPPQETHQDSGWRCRCQPRHKQAAASNIIGISELKSSLSNSSIITVD